MADKAVTEAELRRRWEGQLNKFTNVVKGWQYRWFVLDPETGSLQYFLLDEKSGKCRWRQFVYLKIIFWWVTNIFAEALNTWRAV